MWVVLVMRVVVVHGLGRTASIDAAMEAVL
jgi:hypothetical protein